MLARTTLAVALILSLAGAAAAQSKQEPTIIVIGMGTASRPADFARLGFALRGEGKTPTDALKALAMSREQVENGLFSLAGAKISEPEANNINVEEVRPPACSRDDYDASEQLSTGKCGVVGVVATINMQVKVSPAAKVGDAASYVTQLGAKNASVLGGDLTNRLALENEAAAKAVIDARRQAQNLARAAGVKLGPLLRITDGATPHFGGVEEIAVTGSRGVAAPPRLATPLSLTPPPVEANARVTVMFAIEP